MVFLLFGKVPNLPSKIHDEFRLCWCFSPTNTLLVKQSVKCEETFALRLLVTRHNNGKKQNLNKWLEIKDLWIIGFKILWFVQRKLKSNQSFFPDLNASSYKSIHSLGLIFEASSPISSKGISSIFLRRMQLLPMSNLDLQALAYSA